MPEITVSEELYRQIEAEADSGDLDAVIWEMLGTYRRSNSPQADTTEGHSFDDAR